MLPDNTPSLAIALVLIWEFGATGWNENTGRREERRTRVEESTFFRRGKSEMPESRIEIEESRRERELRREVTDAVSELRDWEVEFVWLYAILLILGEFGDDGDCRRVGDCGGVC